MLVAAVFHSWATALNSHGFVRWIAWLAFCAVCCRRAVGCSRFGIVAICMVYPFCLKLCLRVAQCEPFVLRDSSSFTNCNPRFTFFADASIDTDFSGTTSVLATIRGKKLTCANVGDSRIIVGRLDKSGKMKAVEVSDDHKPDRPDEQKRIEAKGGRVFAVEYEDGVDGPPRVWLGNMDIPGLAMARSLGDVVAHSAGVISTPEHHEHDLTPEDKIIVMGSDGLWEFMSNQEVIDMIVGSGMRDPSDAVDILAEESAARWMREEEVIDDTTIIVAYM